MRFSWAALAALAACVFYLPEVRGDLVCSALYTPYVVTFDATVAGVNIGPYDGTGLSTAPALGQLDSSAWQVTGLAGGDALFGGNYSDGVYGRGFSTGDVNRGGLWSFDTGSGNRTFGFQPVNATLTPGAITLRARNNTGVQVTSIELSYDVWELNNANRSTLIGFAWSTDGTNFTPIPELDFTSGLAASATPVWSLQTLSTTWSLVLPQGSPLFLRWNTSDVAGSGARDELGLDNISVTVIAEPAMGLAIWLSFSLFSGVQMVRAGAPNRITPKRR
jgi:hypothetical protein